MLNVHSITKFKYKKIINYFFNIFGLEVRRKNNWYDKHRDSVVELDKKYKKILKESEKYINTSLPSQWSIIQSLEYIKKNKIKGDIIETGTFHGGGLILINNVLKAIKLKKNIWGYDTFKGIPNINLKHDAILGDKKINLNKKKIKNYDLIYPSLKNVRFNLKKNGFKKLPNLIVGDTRKTLKKKINLPKKISLIRLDTDFYESTLNELKILFPLLSKKGILIIDDYGHHKGSKKAVDDYFKNKNVWLHRIDYTVRLIIK